MNAHDSKDLSRFQAPVFRELAALEGDFREALKSDLPLLQEIAAALAAAPGKRIRPNLLFLASRSTGGSPEKASVAALAVELIHTATLLHDDILDGHMTRRGKATVYARWGADAAMIMGDFLYSRAFSCLGEAGLNEAIEILAKVTNLMSIGELIQLQHRKDIDVSEDGYMELIYRKTASLFAAGRIDAVITGADRIVLNGDSANKIGTLGLAVLCEKFSVPMYIAAPWSTFDLSIENGSGIPIEERDPGEVKSFAGVKTAPDEAGAYNPAFDVTPAGLLTAIITETCVIEAPDSGKIRTAAREAGVLPAE